MSELEKGTPAAKAAAIARDVVVAVASSLENPAVDVPQYAKNLSEGLSTIFEKVQASAQKALSK